MRQRIEGVPVLDRAGVTLPDAWSIWRMLVEPGVAKALLLPGVPASVAALEEEWRVAGVLGEEKRPNSWMLPVRVAGRCVGLVRCEGLELGAGWVTVSVALEPGMRGEGVGKAALDAALLRVREEAAGLRIHAFVGQRNRPGKRMLSACGFEWAGRAGRYENAEVYRYVWTGRQKREG